MIPIGLPTNELILRSTCFPLCDFLVCDLSSSYDLFQSDGRHGVFSHDQIRRQDTYMIFVGIKFAFTAQLSELFSKLDRSYLLCGYIDPSLTQSLTPQPHRGCKLSLDAPDIF